MSPHGRWSTGRAGAASRSPRDTPAPKGDVAELPRHDAAAHEALVGVQDQVQQMLMRRHGQEAIYLDGLEVGKKVVQLVMRILGRIK